MPKHFIIIGRTSRAIAKAVVDTFGEANVIQSRFGTYSDGESNFELFAEGDLKDHPLSQNFSETEKGELKKNLRGAHITIVHSVSGINSSSRAMSLLNALKYLKGELGVGSITVMAPHNAYTRQDREFTRVEKVDGDWADTHRQHNAVSNQNFAELLRLAGADRFVGIDFHSRNAEAQYKEVFNADMQTTEAIHRLTSRFNGEVCLPGLTVAEQATMLTLLRKAQSEIAQGSLPNEIFEEAGIEFLSTTNLMSGWLRRRFPGVNFGFLAPDGANKPDDLAVARAKALCTAFYPALGCEMALRDNPHMGGIVKKRVSPKKTVVDENESFVDQIVSGGLMPLTVDDIVNSGSTQDGACDFVIAQGGRPPLNYATHGVLPNGALAQTLAMDNKLGLVTTDTVPSTVEKWQSLSPELRDRYIIVSVAPLIVDAIAHDHTLVSGRRDAEWNSGDPHLREVKRTTHDTGVMAIAPNMME